MAWGGRIDIWPDDIAQLVDKFRIVRELEVPHTDRDARDLCHQRAGPVRRLAGRIIERQGDNSCGDFIASGLMREGRVLSRSRPSNPSVAKRSCQR
jgi:hypothetical protein